MRRPKTLLALLLLFCWAEAKTLGYLIFPTTSPSYLFFASLGYSWAHFVIAIPSAALAATAIGYLTFPRPGWFEVTLVATCYSLATSIGMALYTNTHLAVYRDAYAAARETRGAAISQERLDTMFQPSLILYTVIASVLFNGIVLFLAWRRREYVDARFVATAAG